MASLHVEEGCASVKNVNLSGTPRARVECQVCCESYLEDVPGVGKTSFAACKNCDFVCCQGCARRYLLETLDDPHCMFCRSGVDRTRLLGIFPRSWVNKDFKNHREDVLMDRERAMIPTSVPAVEREKAKREIRGLLRGAEEERKRLALLLHANQLVVYNLRERMERLRRGVEDGGETSGDRTEPNHAKPVVKCQKEECVGFCAAGSRCPTCDLLTCAQCMEIIDDGDQRHECDPEKKANVVEARKHSKACPGCGEYISKVEGCSQMWCTSCHTTFDYRTGRRVNQAIHNPHYYEYMRRNGAVLNGAPRNPQDVQCGGLPEYHHLLMVLGIPYGRSVQQDGPSESPEVKRDRNACNYYVCRVHRTLSHIQNVEVPRLAAQNDIQAVFEPLRVQFVLGDICENEWKQKLQRMEKKRNAQREFGDVMVTVRTVGTDVMQRLVAELRLWNACPVEKLREFVKEFETLRAYTNGAFKNVSLSYDYKPPYITPEWGGVW